MKIEDARTEDVEAIYEIMRESQRVAYTKELVEDLIKSKESICLKVIDQGETVGALGARAEGENSYWLYFIVVKKEHQGMEYGKELMNMFFEEAKRKGAKRIALDTPDKEFFEKFGFEEVGRIPNWYGDRDQIIMFRPLG